MTLNLSSEIQLPNDVSTECVTIVGMRGTGKSFTVGKLMEELTLQGLRFICFDARGAHSKFNMNNVFHVSPDVKTMQDGDIISGSKLADNMVSNNCSVIFNLKNISLIAGQILLADFCEGLLERGGDGRPLTVIIEEVQDYCGLREGVKKMPSAPSIIRLAKLGRADGFGVWSISQRPAAIGKNLMTQSDLYIVHRVVATVDVDTIMKQITIAGENKGSKEAKLVTFKTGQFMAYSPTLFEDLPGCVAIGKTSSRITEHAGVSIEVPEHPTGFPQSQAATPYGPPYTMNPAYGESQQQNPFGAPNPIHGGENQSPNGLPPFMRSEEDRFSQPASPFGPPSVEPQPMSQPDPMPSFGNQETERPQRRPLSDITSQVSSDLGLDLDLNLDLPQPAAPTPEPEDLSQGLWLGNAQDKELPGSFSQDPSSVKQATVPLRVVDAEEYISLDPRQLLTGKNVLIAAGSVVLISAGAWYLKNREPSEDDSDSISGYTIGV